MPNTDVIHRFLFDNTDVRGEIVTLKESYQQAFDFQQCPLELKPIFGEFLSAVTLLSEILKFDGVITLQARGDGPVPLIMAEANDNGEVRGFIRMSETNERPIMKDGELCGLPEIIGNGVLTITIDPTEGKRYQGIVPLEAPLLEQCLSDYFERSEQLPTSIQLFADETQCAGLFLQCLPTQLSKNSEERNELWSTIKQLGHTVSAKELYELEHTTLLYRLFHEHDCRLLAEKNLRFNCQCSFERSANAVSSMGRENAFALLQERNTITTDCQFCGKRYTFEEKDLLSLFGPENKTH